VASVDAFFGSVISFNAKAGNVSAGIEAQLAAIRGDFGIDAKTELGAGITAAIKANVEGDLTVDAEPAKCEVDAEATIQAQAKCDVDVKPGMASVKCEGSCQVDASADVSCSADADLQCTVQAPSVECSGECSGSCEVMLDAAAECSGTCTGSCSGNCSAYSDSGATQCAGQCDGMCMGSCKTELAASAECKGKCSGECKLTNPPKAMCEGAIKAECKAHANAMVECKGHCDGKFEPPSAKADCQASAKADAKLNVECTPPRVAIKYSLKAGVDADVQAKFVAAVKNLEVRLPALLASIKKASLVAEAGEGLAADASGAVKGAVDGAVDAAAEGNLRVVMGLQCAAKELPKVGDTLSDASDRLSGDLSDSAKVTGALGMK
jgi:hypothetical protein